MGSLSIRAKLTVAVCLVVLVCTAVVGDASIKIATKQELQLARQSLQVTARNLEQSLEHAYSSVANDISILAQIPTFRDFVRQSAEGPGNEGRAAARRETRQDLSEVFAAILAKRHAYAQLRVVSAADAGRELVRVARHAGGTEIVEPNAGRGPASGFDFAEAMERFDHPHTDHSADSHGLFFSTVTFNDGDQGTTTALYAAQPVYGDNGKIVAFVVVDIEFQRLLEVFLHEMGAGSGFVVANKMGDHFSFSITDSGSVLKAFSHASAPVPPIVEETLLFPEGGLYLETADEYYYVEKVAFDDLRHMNSFMPAKDIKILTRLAKSEVYGASSKIHETNTLLVALLSMMAFLATLSISRILTNPLVDLAQKVKTAQSLGERLSLPYRNRSDEVGQLANSFQCMARHLEDSEEMNRTVLNAVGEGIVTIDDGGTIITCNPVCEDIFGYSVEECLGNNIAMLTPAPVAESRLEQLKQFFETHEPNASLRWVEEEGLRKNGETFPLELTVSQLESGDRQLFVSVVRDRTETRAVEKAKSEFFATVSHELRTPLTSVIGAVSICLENPNEPLTENQRTVLQIARDNSEKLKLLVNDILDIEKLGSEEVQPVFGQVDIGVLVRDVIIRHKIAAKQRGVAVVFEDADLQASVFGDPEQLERVFENLISNATKFSDPGDTVRVSSQVRDGGVRVTVADTGIGIPDDFKDKIFDRFTQHDSSDERKYAGTGLGLSIVKAIVERHRGRIGFESTEGVGTVFQVDLPTAPERQVARPESETVAVAMAEEIEVRRVASAVGEN